MFKLLLGSSQKCKQMLVAMNKRFVLCIYAFEQLLVNHTFLHMRKLKLLLTGLAFAYKRLLVLCIRPIGSLHVLLVAIKKTI